MRGRTVMRARGGLCVRGCGRVQSHAENGSAQKQLPASMKNHVGSQSDYISEIPQVMFLSQNFVYPKISETDAL
ncbi:hypothetical protein AD935_00160 [Gluconobacter japonicus]|nr:hypothetical protein AD935_00160 [Gluconobacter japonicus]